MTILDTAASQIIPKFETDVQIKLALLPIAVSTFARSGGSQPAVPVNVPAEEVIAKAEAMFRWVVNHRG